jgi:hypothetical protein
MIHFRIHLYYMNTIFPAAEDSPVRSESDASIRTAQVGSRRGGRGSSNTDSESCPGSAVTWGFASVGVEGVVAVCDT